MRIRIKGAGWLIIIGGVLLVAGVIGGAYLKQKMASTRSEIPSYEQQGVDPSRQVTKTASQKDKEIAAAASVDLKDGDFEGKFDSVNAPMPGQKAHIQGVLPEGWFDLSTWSDLDVTYSRETNDAQNGKACLRMDVNDIRSQAVLLVQPVKVVKGKTYVVTAYAKASATIPIVFGLRQRGRPYRYYGQVQDATIGSRWQKISVNATVTDDKYPFAYVSFEEFKPNVTVWLDDVEFHPTN